MTLNELAIGDSARIEAVFGEGVLRQHLLDMGVIPGAEVTLIKYAPMGDPMEIKIHGYELTLRLDDAKNIKIEPVKNSDKENERTDRRVHKKSRASGSWRRRTLSYKRK